MQPRQLHSLSALKISITIARAIIYLSLYPLTSNAGSIDEKFSFERTLTNPARNSVWTGSLFYMDIPQLLGEMQFMNFKTAETINAKGTITYFGGDEYGYARGHAEVDRRYTFVDMGASPASRLSQWNIDCDDVADCEPVYYTVPFDVTKPLPDLEHNSSLSSGMTAANISYRIEYKMGANDYVENLSATLNHIINANLSLTYNQRPTQEYKSHALDLAKSDGRSGLSATQQAWQIIAETRKFGDATASQNLNLRNAEYFWRGYAGAVQTVSDLDYSSFTNFVNTFGNSVPGSVTIYNGLKALKFAVGTNLAGEGERPNSPVGGDEHFYSGFIHGKLGHTPEEALQPLPSSENSVENPLIPKFQFEYVYPGTGLIENSIFLLEHVDPHKLQFFDPEVSNSYYFSVEGNSFASFLFPTLPDQSVSHFNVHIGSLELAWEPEKALLFSGYVDDPVTFFAITGIEWVTTPTDGEPVFGIAFSTDNTTAVSITTARNITAPVPLPATVWLFCAALATIGRFAFKRR